MPRRPTNTPSPLTYREISLHYNIPGESFSVQCPVCNHAVVDVARRPKEGLKVQCDRGCSPKKIIKALTALVRGEPPLPSQAQTMLPLTLGSHPPEPQDLAGTPQFPAPLPRVETPDVIVAAGATIADGDNPVGEIVLIGSPSESRSCQHQVISWVRAPDNGDLIPRCVQCSALMPSGDWLHWKQGVGWHVRKNSASKKYRYDPSTGTLRRVDMDDIERVPVCRQCRGTIEVDGQCLFCAYPRGSTFPDAA